MKKIIIFDFDGTLANTNEISYNIYVTMCERYNVPVLTKDELKELKQLPVKERLKKINVPLRRVPKLLRESWTLYYDHMESVSYFDGIEAVLTRLSDLGLKLVILSSNDRKNIERFLSFQTVQPFETIYDKAKALKKDKVLKKLLKKERMSLAEALYIGDELRDVDACVRMGMDIVAVTWGLDEKEILQKHNPGPVVDTPQALLESIENYL